MKMLIIIDKKSRFQCLFCYMLSKSFGQVSPNVVHFCHIILRISHSPVPIPGPVRSLSLDIFPFSSTYGKSALYIFLNMLIYS